MHLTDQHKALLITCLISGTMVMAVFNLNFKNQKDVIAESFYKLEPEKELTEEEKKLEALENQIKNKAETNNAYNEADKNKHVSDAYQQIAPPKDYVPKTSEEQEGEGDESNALGENKPIKPAINKDALSTYNKVNDVLKQQQNAGVNTKSSVSFSLLNRKKVNIPVPVYLCEVDGKIIINITVNAQGNVIDAYVNNASSSKNDCLIDYALQYAKSAQFSADASKNTQLGTITFRFIGKQ